MRCPQYPLLNIEWYNMGTKHPATASQAGNMFVTMNRDSFHSDGKEEDDEGSRVEKQKKNV